MPSATNRADWLKFPAGRSDVSGVSSLPPELAALRSVPRPRGTAEQAPSPAAPGAELDWTALIHDVLADPSLMRLVFQPIVGLNDGEVVGYEALARFEGPPGLTPDLWFAAADRLGHGVALESRVVQECLRIRSTLPGNCFLTVNVSPHLLVEPDFADLLRGAGDLSPLVLELTEHRAVEDLRPLVALRDELTAQGATIALDDAGSGYSGLRQMSTIRPHLIKLDRALVTDADQDEVKLALAELLGGFAGRLDAWLLVEGVETWGELDAFIRLGVPLAQGYLLGRPAPPWSTLDPQTAARLRASRARPQLADHVGSLLEQGTALYEGGPPHEPRPGEVCVVQDGRRRPVGLLLPGPTGGHRQAPLSLRVRPSATVVEVAERLLSRPPEYRWDPVVCTDGEGRYAGFVRVERILQRLAQVAAPG